MKRILITGANSYIGTSFVNYIKEHHLDEYVVNTIDMTDSSWCERSFVGYDSVFHVAGIAHQKETRQNAELYYQINSDLTVKVAQKAKKEGVKQFIFLSSMSVYGMDTGVISRETLPNPKSNYGKSKWLAEQQLTALANDDFKVCIVRPPMVYGKGCKGNFVKIKKIVEKAPIFPCVKNQRSMIYIDNLCAYIELCVQKELEGVFLPQNKEYGSTVDMAKEISMVLGKRMVFDVISGAVVKLLALWVPMLKKAFGTLIYHETEDFDFSYVIVENGESIRKSI